MTISRRSIMLLIAVIVIAAAAAIGFALAASGDSDAGTAKTVFTVSGTMDLGQCARRGAANPADLQVGAQVEVTAQNGDVLGVGTLTPYANPDEPNSCKRSFDVPNVPSGQALYGVHVGNANRGVIWKNEADAGGGFELSIS